MHVLPLSFRSPLEVFQEFAPDKHAALLDSAVSDRGRGRYAYIAAEPVRLIRARGSTVTVDDSAVEGDPFTVLERELAKFKAEELTGPLPFTGGAVGYLGYDLGRHLERLPAPAEEGFGIPDMVMGLYDTIIGFDLQTRQAWVTGPGPLKVERLAARIYSAPPLPPLDWSATSSWVTEQERAAVEAAIAQAIRYIGAGDIFQANVTQRLFTDMPPELDDLALYRRLRELSPAPFAAFLRCGDVAVLSASPERFLRLDPHGRVETRPIKGTRPRDRDPEVDAALADELLASVKDRAENLMIVDLMRNDISRVCEIGSVHVPTLVGLESFASVHHLVSVIEGQLRAGLGPIDLLRACFPGGSITGAPKIRAMEIIRDLEPAPRGVYCGSIAWIGFDGAMDSSIVIRTLTRVGTRLIAQAGGGIVADSDPAAEYEESMLKMHPLLRAVTGDSQ